MKFMETVTFVHVIKCKTMIGYNGVMHTYLLYKQLSKS